MLIKAKGYYQRPTVQQLCRRWNRYQEKKNTGIESRNSCSAFFKAFQTVFRTSIQLLKSQHDFFEYILLQRPWLTVSRMQLNVEYCSRVFCIGTQAQVIKLEVISCIRLSLKCLKFNSSLPCRGWHNIYDSIPRTLKHHQLLPCRWVRLKRTHFHSGKNFLPYPIVTRKRYACWMSFWLKY